MNEPAERVWTRDFILITGILFLSAAGLAVFFDFQKYLESLHLPTHWLGPLVSADASATLVVQILITPLLNVRNARRGAYVGTILYAVALVSYQWAISPVAILLVRLLNGCGFAFLIASLMVLLVPAVPVSRSGYAFGIISMVRLVPYAMIPPILGFLSLRPEDFCSGVAVTAFIMVALLPMIWMMRSQVSSESPAQRQSQPALSSLGRNLLDRPIATLLLVTLLLNSGYVIVFYYIRQYATTINVRNPGLFFTIATTLMIATRLFGAAFLDRLDKRHLAMWTQMLLVAAYLLLVFGQGEALFFLTAFLAGLGWGVTFPLVNALLFERSRPEFRGANMNAGMIMYQAGFFLGSFLGGEVLVHSGYVALFSLCAVTAAGIMLLLWSLSAKEKEP